MAIEIQTNCLFSLWVVIELDQYLLSFRSKERTCSTLPGIYWTLVLLQTCRNSTFVKGKQWSLNVTPLIHCRSHHHHSFLRTLTASYEQTTSCFTLHLLSPILQSSMSKAAIIDQRRDVSQYLNYFNLS